MSERVLIGIDKLEVLRKPETALDATQTRGRGTVKVLYFDDS